MEKVTNLSKVCKEFFFEKADDLAIVTGFIKRKRKITGSSFIRTLVLGNIADGHCSIDGMCQLLGEDCIDITKQGLDFRFTKSAVEFMQAMYKESLSLFKTKLQLNCQILEQFSSVKLLDIALILICQTIWKIFIKAVELATKIEKIQQNLLLNYKWYLTI